MAPILITALFGTLVSSIDPVEVKPATHDVQLQQLAEHHIPEPSAKIPTLEPALRPAPMMEKQSDLWELHPKDMRLDLAMKRWADKAGYSFRWDADRYVLISAETVYSGSFESAINSVLKSPSIRLSAYPLEACIYSNVPPLVRVTRLGDQAKECQP